MKVERIAPGVFYVPRFVDEPDATLGEALEQVHFTQRARWMYGRKAPTPRMEAWHGPTPYRFGGSELPACEMPPVLRALALRAEMVLYSYLRTRAMFDTCLANLYRDGRDSVGWHADDEPEMGDPIIASISLGAERVFKMRRKANHRDAARADVLAGAPWATANNISVTLAHGSMLVMLRGVQNEWEHCVPKMLRCLDARVNLTYRDTPARQA